MVRLYLRKQEILKGLVKELDDEVVQLQPLSDSLADGEASVLISAIRKVRMGTSSEIAEQYGIGKVDVF